MFMKMTVAVVVKVRFDFAVDCMAVVDVHRTLPAVLDQLMEYWADGGSPRKCKAQSQVTQHELVKPFSHISCKNIFLPDSRAASW